MDGKELQPGRNPGPSRSQKVRVSIVTVWAAGDRTPGFCAAVRQIEELKAIVFTDAAALAAFFADMAPSVSPVAATCAANFRLPEQAKHTKPTSGANSDGRDLNE